jgi:hypothetical protein
MFGMGLTLLAAVNSYLSLSKAWDESTRLNSSGPLEDEVTRQAAMWGFGLTATLALDVAVKGLLAGSELGPYGMVAGFAIGLAVGIAASNEGLSVANDYIEDVHAGGALGIFSLFNWAILGH